MITIIAETNFAFDILFERDRASGRILELAKDNEITLRLPVFSIAEVRGQVIEIVNNRKEKLELFRSFLKELSRSEYYRDEAKTCQSKIDLFLKLNQEDYRRAQEIIKILLDYCKIIDYSPITATKAELRFKEKRPPFKETDCKIYESILEFLKEKEGKVLFLTKDKDDFDFPEIKKELESYDSEIYFSSDMCLKKINELLKK